MRIKLGGKYAKGRYALVDDADKKLVSICSWSMSGRDHNYVRGKIGRKCVFLHRLILNPPSNLPVDHINGNPLDNRRSNLRVVTASQGMINTPIRKDNKTGYRGVCFNKEAKKYRAMINVNHKHIFLGYYTDLIEAANAYSIAAMKHHGPYRTKRTNETGNSHP